MKPPVVADEKLRPHAEWAWRTIAAVSGSTPAADRIVRWLLVHAPRSDSATIERWFRHHAVLRRRELKRPKRNDPDVLEPAGASVALRAFVAAIRNLPEQQREAWLLRVCAKLDPRDTGKAMDCSQTAALTHYEAALAVLKPMAGDDYEAFCTGIRTKFESLKPDSLEIDRALAARSTRRWIRITLGASITAGLIAVLGGLIWFLVSIFA